MVVFKLRKYIQWFNLVYQHKQRWDILDSAVEDLTAIDGLPLDSIPIKYHKEEKWCENI